MISHVPICCQVCERREDEQAEIVRVRLQGAGTDLHGVDARYHTPCYQAFKSERNIKAATRRSATSNTLASEVTVEIVVLAVRAGKDRAWSSAELHTLYKEKEGVDCNRSRLVNTLKEVTGNEIMMLSSSSVAIMLISKSKAATVLHLDEVDQDNFDLQ